MSWAETFNKLHLTIKIAFVTITAQIPFFFVAFYLFDNKLVSKIGENIFVDVHFWFLVSACFCLSITWFVATLILTFIIAEKFDKFSDSTSTMTDLFQVNIIYCIGYLSLSILTNYFLNCGFKVYILLIFGFLLLRVIWILFISSVFSKRIMN